MIPTPLDFRILGPLEVRAGGVLLSVGGVRQRALLALLLLSANRVVSRERLIDELSGDGRGPASDHALRVQASRLRKALRADGADSEPRLVARAPGYVLRVEPGELDLHRFEQLAADGRRALKESDRQRAVELLRKAESLWRGRPLADLEFEPSARLDIERLEELRLGVVEDRIGAELERGRDTELVAELRQRTRDHPWRERLHAQLMLALYRSGRQADALQAYRSAREVLVEQLGIEPGAELAGLHQSILTHDLALESPRATVAERRDALPALPNRTIGRRHELAAVSGRLRVSSVRLVTLTGPGGVGKTRLALEAARAVDADFADGAHLVLLAAVQRPQDVAAAIVESLAIIQLAGESAEQAVARFLALKHLLLVVDNCEHLLPAAPLIGRLLSACPALTVLATSRAPLALHAEQLFAVSPLALPGRGTPEEPEALLRVAAVALFCERAQAHDPGFHMGDGNAAAVAQICRRVDGLPLAIELAAARCGLLSAPEIADRLNGALGALGTGPRDAPARQQTLSATIDWSHDLLSASEKACFARLAVFPRAATVEAAEAITGADLDTLDRLVAKSLLTRHAQSPGASRLGMLETIRAYAAERFADDADAEDVRERHYRWFLALAERHGSERALFGADGQEDLTRLDADAENLHAALGWAVDRRDGERATAMVAALARYWWMRDRYADAVAWIDRALSVAPVDEPSVPRLRALLMRGLALWPLGRSAELPQAIAELDAGAAALGDPAILAQVQMLRLFPEIRAGRLDVADAIADEGLRWATLSGDRWTLAEAAWGKAEAASTVSELRVRVDTAAALLEDVGNVYQLANLLASASYQALCLGSEHDAKQFVDRAIPVIRDLGHPYLWMMLHGNRGLAALLTGDPNGAEQAFRAELRLCRELVVPPIASEGLLGLAAVAVARDDLHRAARLLGASAAQRYGEPADPVDARLDATYFHPARARHGADRWDTAAREGAALNFNDAVAYALEEAGTPRTPT
jgi:predicted ATPase/DNA-binding SARP family transcriptional activator